jgi:hypothetical protein
MQIYYDVIWKKNHLRTYIRALGVILIVVIGVHANFLLLDSVSHNLVTRSNQESSSFDSLEMRRENGNDDRNSEDCQRILLYATDYLNPGGLVAQLNTYLRASLIAILENRRLTFLHSTDDSMFGCPLNVNDTHSNCPGGLSQLIDPSPLSHHCGVPSCHNIQKWFRLGYRVIQKKDLDPQINCKAKTTNETVSVLLLGGYPIRNYFRDHIQPRLEAASKMEEWAPRLGANASQIQSMISEASDNSSNLDLYRDQVLSLLKPMIRWQPWIQKDVQALWKDYDPLPKDYVGIHIRRGDKLLVEAKYWVEEYWKNRGYTSTNMPENYIPVSAYLEKVPLTAKHVYIATDDMQTVQEEIKELPLSQQRQFHFNPLMTTGHLNTLADSRDQYQHTIAAIFDLTVLTNAKVFVGEYNSNWGRWVRFKREGEVRVVFGPTDISWPR